MADEAGVSWQRLKEIIEPGQEAFSLWNEKDFGRADHIATLCHGRTFGGIICAPFGRQISSGQDQQLAGLGEHSVKFVACLRT
jgi:hypothetical protein